VRAISLLAVLALSATPLDAQRIQPSPFARADFGVTPGPAVHWAMSVAARSDGPDEGKMILGGVLLGAGGLFAGALIGDRFQAYPCEDCIEGAVFGALIGESLGIPLGVHLGNGRRGTAGPALAASLGIGAVTLGTAAVTDKWGILLALPVLQIAASIGIERHTAAGKPLN
jgi:hypothetical protein